VTDTNALTNLQIGPWLTGQPGSQSLPNRLYFCFLHRNWGTTDTDDLAHTRRHKQRPTVVQIKTTEQVSREERLLHFLHAVRPAPNALADGQEAFITLTE
jgi:hypothetical protein